MAFKLGDRDARDFDRAWLRLVHGQWRCAGRASFASVMTSNGDTTWYAATNGTGWETGLLTRTSATVYARTTIYASSNSGSAVNFSTGTVDVFCDLPGSKAIRKPFRLYQ
jgi:hypothetical protein